MRLRLDPTSPSGVSLTTEPPIVKQQNGYVTKTQRLGELTDVSADSPTSGQALAYNSTLAKWTPQTIAGGSGGTGTVDTVVAGTGITVNSTDPANPIVASSITQYTDALAAAAAPVQSVAAKTGTVTLVKADVGLGNVDNTADASKPVSTAQQSALDLKAPLASPTFTGTTTSAAEAITNTNGTLNITSVTDGGDFNINQTTGLTKTLALYGSAAGILHLNLLDGAFYTASVIRLSNAGVLQNVDLTGTGNTFPTFNQNTTGSAAKWTTPRTLAGNSVDGSANTTFANKFIVQGTADAGLSAAQFLGALGTGLLKNTTTTGVLSTATSGTDYAPGTSALGTGILKSTTTTGALTIAVAADFPTLNQNSTGTASNITGTLAVSQGGTGATANTGTGNNVLASSPSLTTPTIGSAGANLSGSTSGTTILKAAATASGTLTLPAVTDTLVGQATADTLTNKTISGASNTISNVPTSALVLNGAASASVATSESTASTTYADLATTTDTVTVTIGASGKAMVTIVALIFSTGSIGDNYMSFSVSGATTTAAADTKSISNRNTAGISVGGTFIVTGLAAGSTTFKLKYRTSAGTANYLNRNIGVIPL